MPTLLAKLLALLQKLGPQVLPLVEYLLAHKDQIASLIELLTTLFGTTPKTATEVSADHVIEEGRKHGIATGDLQELLAALPE